MVFVVPTIKEDFMFGFNLVLAHSKVIHKAHLKLIHLSYHFCLLPDEPLGVSR